MKTTELNKLNIKELDSLIDEKQLNYVKTKIKVNSNEEKNTAVLKGLRKEIAQIATQKSLLSKKEKVSG